MISERVEKLEKKVDRNSVDLIKLKSSLETTHKITKIILIIIGLIITYSQMKS